MGEVNNPTIVVSAINIFEGGPLTVLNECLECLNHNYTKKYKIIALVHKIELFPNFKNIDFIELPKSRTSWLYRVYYEYIYFNKLSKQLKPYLWLSLHDTSPILSNTSRQCVYCHNPSIFYNTSFSELKYDTKHVLFSIFYKYLYRINQKNNLFLIVQQEWIRDKFIEKYHIPQPKIVVAYPTLEVMKTTSPTFSETSVRQAKTFIYAAFPRVFKNYEIIVKASKVLLNRGITDFQIKFTIDGTENLYAKKIKEMSTDIKQIVFLGLLPRSSVLAEYQTTDALIFPSKLETWGLPITEFKSLNKPIFAADLEYARETVGNYDKATFFDADDEDDLANRIELAIKNKGDWQQVTNKMPENPFTTSWNDLINYIVTN